MPTLFSVVPSHNGGAPQKSGGAHPIFFGPSTFKLLPGATDCDQPCARENVSVADMLPEEMWSSQVFRSSQDLRTYNSQEVGRGPMWKKTIFCRLDESRCRGSSRGQKIVLKNSRSGTFLLADTGIFSLQQRRNIQAIFFSQSSGQTRVSLVCHHRHEIKKYSPGYMMHEDCPPLLAGQKKVPVVHKL